MDAIGDDVAGVVAFGPAIASAVGKGAVGLESFHGWGDAADGVVVTQGVTLIGLAVATQTK